MDGQNAKKMTDKELLFIKGFRELQRQVHQTGREKGWWDSPLQDEAQEILRTATIGPEVREFLENVKALPIRNEGEILALIHSEVSEALEGLRHGNPKDDKIPKFSAVEAELADVIIRIADFSEASGMDVAGAVIAKARMNQTRSYKHGGKTF